MDLHSAMKFIKYFFIFVSISMYAEEFSKEEAYQSAKQIQKDQIKLFACELTNEELIAATKFDLMQKNISLSTFSDLANKTHILVKALKQIVLQGAKPDIVFIEMELERYGISKENWNYYSKNYKTVEKIAKLKEMIPDNENKIVEQFSEQLKPLLEEYLLEMKIITNFDNKNPGKLHLPQEEKLFLWWKETLIKYDIKAEHREIIIQVLSQGSQLPPQDQKYWHSFFEQKLKE